MNSIDIEGYISQDLTDLLSVVETKNFRNSSIFSKFFSLKPGLEIKTGFHDFSFKVDNSLQQSDVPRIRISLPRGQNYLLFDDDLNQLLSSACNEGEYISILHTFEDQITLKAKPISQRPGKFFITINIPKKTPLFKILPTHRYNKETTITCQELIEFFDKNTFHCSLTFRLNSAYQLKHSSDFGATLRLKEITISNKISSNSTENPKTSE